MSEFASVLEGKIFTFIVGPEKKEFQVHNKLVAKHSDRLDCMMNNGKMKESIEERADNLEYLDPETFTRFAEFIYHGAYRATSTDSKGEKREFSTAEIAQKLQAAGIRNYYCCKCGSGVWDISQYISHFPQHVSQPCGKVGSCCCICATSMPIPSNLPICQGCIKTRNLNLTGNASCNESKIWKNFVAKEIGAMGMSHIQLKDHLLTLVPKDEASDDPLGHAKLYVFADKYNVQGLKALALHKLHRDLMVYCVHHDTVATIVELIEYTYGHTMENDDDDNVEVGSGCELKDLVIAFVASHAEALRKMKDFRALLRKGGSWVSDFTNAIANHLE